jgi:hypothetical protein
MQLLETNVYTTLTFDGKYSSGNSDAAKFKGGILPPGKGTFQRDSRLS